MLSEHDFHSLLIMFFFELVFVSLKVTIKVVINIIIIVVLRDFTANGFLYIDGEFSAVYRGA